VKDLDNISLKKIGGIFLERTEKKLVKKALDRRYLYGADREKARKESVRQHQLESQTRRCFTRNQLQVFAEQN
jgi:hypothetical protein